jgi:hypothetical protein
MPFRPLQRFNGLLDRMVPQENYGGLLSPQDQHATAQAYRAQLASSLLSAAGPQRMPVSLGQAIGSAIPQAMQVRDQRAEVGLRNEQLRRQIESENKRTAAHQKLGGLLRNVGGPDGELLGLVYDVSPEAAIGMLTNKERTDTVAARMQQLGYPMTPEGWAAYNAAEGSDTAGANRLAEIQAELAIMSRKDEIERNRREDAKTEQEAAATRGNRANALRRSLTQTAEIVEHAEKLEGTLLAAGLPAASIRSAGMSTLAGLGAAVGIDTSELSGQVDEFNKMKKGMSDQLINLIEAGDLGDPTNSKLTQYRDALSNPETSLGAIKDIQSKIARDLLDQAEVDEIDIAGRDEFEGNIERWRGFERTAQEPIVNAPAIVRRVADVARMSIEQLQNLDPAGLSEEVRAAAEKRWDELNAE